MTNRRYEIPVEETSYFDEEEEAEDEQECEEEDLLSNDDDESSEFHPIPYHFKLKDVLGEPVDLLPDDMAKVRINCPPFHTLLDHCLAVLWLGFKEESEMLQSGDLNWAIKFLEGLKNNQNRRTEDVQMALEFLQRSLHNLCLSIEIDDVRQRKYKRYMDLSRSFNSLQFNKGVILKGIEEGVPDYAAFVKCIDKRKNATHLESTLEEHPENIDTDSNICGLPCPMDPCGDPCNQTDPYKSTCPDEDVDEDVCEMLDLIGDTPPIILMDLLDHDPELLAKAMKKDDDCSININLGSSECLPDDEACLLEEAEAKEAKKDRLKDALCQIKNVELIIAEFFESANDRDGADGEYEGMGAH